MIKTGRWPFSDPSTDENAFSLSFLVQRLKQTITFRLSYVLTAVKGIQADKHKNINCHLQQALDMIID